MKTFLYRKIQFSLLKSLSRAIINNNCRLINKYSNPMRNLEYNKYNIIDNDNNYNDININQFRDDNTNIEINNNNNTIRQVLLTQIRSSNHTATNNNNHTTSRQQ